MNQQLAKESGLSPLTGPFSGIAQKYTQKANGK